MFKKGKHGLDLEILENLSEQFPPEMYDIVRDTVQAMINKTIAGMMIAAQQDTSTLVMLSFLNEKGGVGRASISTASLTAEQLIQVENLIDSIKEAKDAVSEQ